MSSKVVSWLVGISETSRGTVETNAQPHHNDDDTSYDETEYAAWAAWIAAAAGAFALIWNTDLSFLSGLLLLSVAAVWGFRLAPWIVVRRVLALILGGGFPWLIWTLDLVPTLAYDNYEGHWGPQAELNKFLQGYAVEKSKLEARKKGHSVSETRLQDGSIRVVVKIGGGT